MSELAVDHDAPTAVHRNRWLEAAHRHTGRLALIVGGAILLLLVLSQLLLPGIGESTIENRLTENGGVAKVELSALPAARLLWGDGDRIAVTGTELHLDLETSGDDVVFDDLDRFGDVQINLDHLTAGPFKVETFVLTRDGDAPYSLRSQASTSASELAQYGIDRAALPGGGIVGALLNLTGLGGTQVPIDLDMELASDDGRIRVVGGGGTIAGFPAGPLATLMTSAIVIKL